MKSEKAAVIHEHINKPGFVVYLIENQKVVSTRESRDYKDLYYAAALWVDVNMEKGIKH